ncbi:MAG: hypothetical protein LBH25_03145 [Fibromonadaceae bacterium]|nr:hypothetical protein [Fibromonadaceae bacterium]
MKAITLLALLCIAAFAQQKGSFIDSRDGKIYKTAKIGEQVWMAENLNYEAEGSRCYNDSISYCNKYGRFYNWAMAMGIDKEFNEKKWNGSDVKHQGVCPNGWHLPSNDDWDKLYRYADGTSDTESPYRSKTAGKYLKSKEGWNDYEGKSVKGEDKFGFSALPGGGYSGGGFYDVGYYGSWWSSSEYSSDGAYDRYMGYFNEYAYWSYDVKSNLFSVRCVRD